MNEHLRDRIQRKLETLSDERGYQVLDYVEFLESKYAERQPSGENVITRLTDSVEDMLRAGRVSTTVIAETIGFLNRASNVLNGALAAGRSVADDVIRTVTPTGETPAQLEKPPEGPEKVEEDWREALNREEAKRRNGQT